MIDIGTAIRHYKRPEIQKELIYSAENKEAVARFGDSFGQRPDVLRYPKDILELVQRGATSFHASEELWNYPLRLNPNMPKTDIDLLRIGWDLVLDIDHELAEKDNIEFSKIAADEVVKLLKKHGIGSASVKFSGNKGFHIGVPFEAFPETISGKDSKLMFPEAARIAAAYIKDGISERVANKIMETTSIATIKEKLQKDIPPEFRPNEKDDLESAYRKTGKWIETFLKIDTILISTRHLYRMPYSLHEKSGLVSIPIDPLRITEFNKKEAVPEAVTEFNFRFLDRSKANKGETQEFFDQAYYHHLQNASTAKKEEKAAVNYPDQEGAIPQQYWPPCIKKLMEGMEDGRKRGLFILINFLSTTGYEYKGIETIVVEWNKKNKPPLGEAYIQGQLIYCKQKKKNAPPPNCNNTGYYSDLGIKCPEQICSKCKNPVVFAKRKGAKLYK